MIERFPDKFSTSFSRLTSIDVGDKTLLFVSGQVGMPAEGPPRVVAETFDEEARLCFRNVELALAEVGASLKNLVRINGYLTRAEDYPAYDKVRKELLSAAAPASATVIVAGLLANARLEIDAIAVIEKR
jgi:enamine deaminase RidA (YjgF/YER057c/UK114 family)